MAQCNTIKILNILLQYNTGRRSSSGSNNKKVWTYKGKAAHCRVLFAEIDITNKRIKTNIISDSGRQWFNTTLGLFSKMPSPLHKGLHLDHTLWTWHTK